MINSSSNSNQITARRFPKSVRKVPLKDFSWHTRHNIESRIMRTYSVQWKLKRPREQVIFLVWTKRSLTFGSMSKFSQNFISVSQLFIIQFDVFMLWTTWWHENHSLLGLSLSCAIRITTKPPSPAKLHQIQSLLCPSHIVSVTTHAVELMVQ